MVKKSTWCMVLALLMLVYPLLLAAPNSVSASTSLAGTIYYVDSVGGNDSNNGTSAATAWQSLTKVNSVDSFSPGDKILLKTGSVWNSQHLSPKGSGASGNPIVLDTYGTGNKPIINVNKTAFAGVYFENQEYWEVNNLEITNFTGTYGSDNTGTYVGVHFRIKNNANTFNHLYVQNCYIHDVDGNPALHDNTLDKATGGISYVVEAWGTSDLGHFNDVLIQNNTIKYVSKTGIEVAWSWYAQNKPEYYSTNVIIRNNVFDHVAGDTAFFAQVSNGLAEGNVSTYGADRADNVAVAGIWSWSSNDITYQKNEVAYIQYKPNAGDLSAWDFDLYNGNQIFQYNYSHGNAGGFMLTMNGTQNTNIARYNISANEPIQAPHHGSEYNLWYYNNVFYNDTGVITARYAYNNVFVNCTDLSYINTISADHDYNAYYNSTVISEPNGIYTDPKFVDPNPGDGFSSLEGFKLQPSSPLIDAGMVINAPGTQDFFGNPIYNQTPDIGAFEMPIVSNAGFESGSLGSWTTWNDAGISSSNAKNGNASVRIGDGPASVEQVITVKPNTTYILSGYGMAPAGQQLDIGVKNFGGDDISEPITSTSYKEGKVTFTTGTTNTTATIYLYHPSGSGNAYGDDISVAEKTDSVSNGGFESGALTPWTTWNDAAISSTNAKTGTYAVRVGNGPASVEQAISVKPNTSYMLSGYAKAPSGQQISIGVKNYGGPEKFIPISSANYTNGTVTFTTGLGSFQATIYLYHPSGSGNAYADDIQVTEAGAGVIGTLVNLDGTGSGRIFDGEGVISGGGGNTKLLIDYPEPYRSDILDYLFKPNFGASFQELKVEIGGDINSTSGTEPSHARTRAENANPNMTRGYETWLINEAKKRNPNIKLSGLQWGAPGWVGNGNIWSQDNADYLVSYIKGLKSVWGYDLDYIAGNQNEQPNGTSQQARDYIVNILRPTLDNNGLSHVKIVAPDILSDNWAFADQIVNDPALKSAVAAIGYHYVNSSSTYNAQNSGLPIWESEGWTGIGDWNGSLNLAKELNLNYIKGKLTKTNIWHAISSQYNNTSWAHSGIMEANTPWSGNYIVQPAIWATAHTTQFAQPGWQYLDSGSGVAAGGTSYVTFKKPDSSDYSVVLVTGSSPESMTFNLSGGLSTDAVHVWKSNSSAQFVQQSDIQVNGGSYSVNLEANSIYSLTTTTGQQKGVSPNPIPDNSPLVLGNSYSENFESYTTGKTPKYMYDIEGAFEVSDSYGGGTGKTLRQVILKPQIPWNSWGNYPNPSTFTEFGDLNWQNYDYSADTLIENSGAVSIYGRVGTALSGGNVNDYKGYRLSTYSNGKWYLSYGDPYTYETGNDIVLATGTVAGISANTWHNLKLSFMGTSIKAYVDNNLVASVSDSRRGSGMAGLGSGWNQAQFDNIQFLFKKVVNDNQTGSGTDQFEYSSGWGYTSYESGAYSNDNHYSNTVDAYALLRFNGSKVQLYGAKNNNQGIAAISVDGGQEMMVDTYASSRSDQQLLFESDNLANQEHVLKIRVTGQKNASASNTYLSLDRADIKSEETGGDLKVQSITITSPSDSISVKGGSLALGAVVLPANATNKTVTWDVYEADGTTVSDKATINVSGVLTAVKDGTVKVVATAVDGSEAHGEMVITLSGQTDIIDPGTDPVSVATVNVKSADNVSTITVKNGSLHLQAEVLPANATNKSVTWAVYEANGITVSDKATINVSGVLTAVKDGVVKVVATAEDGSEVHGEMVISLSGQTDIIDPGTDPVNVATINLTSADNASTITAKNGSLQIQATILPDNATNKSVTWAVYEANGVTLSDKATINLAGLLTAVKDGVVKVVATAADGSEVQGEMVITLSGQTTIINPGPSGGYGGGYGGGYANSTPTTKDDPTRYVPKDSELKVVPAEGGDTAVTAVIDRERLAQKLADLHKTAETDRPVLNIDIPGDHALNAVELPVDILYNSLKENPGTILTVHSHLGTYELPLSILDQAGAAGTDKGATLIIRMDKAKTQQEKQFEQSIRDKGLDRVSDIVDYKVILKSKDKEEEIHHFGSNFVTRAINVDGAITDPSAATAVVYDPVTGEVQFVPSVFTVKDGKTVVTITRNTNSMYAIVQNKKTFDDMMGHWAQKDVEMLASKMIINGTTDHTYTPEMQVTRAQFAALLVRGLGLPTETTVSVFTDVAATQWYAAEVNTAAKLGLVQGTAAGIFSPDQLITREQMVVMLMKAVALVQGAVKTDVATTGQFADQDQLSDYARKAVAEAADKGLVHGKTETTFAPQDVATRAEAAVTIKQALQYLKLIN